jgi:hypothetical protein
MQPGECPDLLEVLIWLHLLVHCTSATGIMVLAGTTRSMGATLMVGVIGIAGTCGYAGSRARVLPVRKECVPVCILAYRYAHSDRNRYASQQRLTCQKQCQKHYNIDHGTSPYDPASTVRLYPVIVYRTLFLTLYLGLAEFAFAWLRNR